MKDAIAALFSSRKFLIVTLALITCTVLVLTGKIPAASLMSNVQILAGVLVATIGAEDFAKKWGEPAPAAIVEKAKAVEVADPKVES